MNDEEKNSTVRITGQFMGHPIDVTICEGEEPEHEVEPAPSVTEVQEPDVTDEQEREGAVADPAPPAKELTEEPKNPAGNAEQV